MVYRAPITSTKLVMLITRLDNKTEEWPFCQFPVISSLVITSNKKLIFDF